MTDWLVERQGARDRPAQDVDIGRIGFGRVAYDLDPQDTRDEAGGEAERVARTKKEANEMSFETRRPLLEKLEEHRGSKILCYITSIRPNATANMSDEAVRPIIEHLRRLPQQPIDQLDLLIVSNGGDGTVPWRSVPIFREYGKKFNVLIPYKAYSAATLMALGANEIVMHRFGAMGPIDPTVTNDFNPVESGTNRRLGISVEDVKAYVSFIKDTVGIKHEEELVKTVEILAQKIHPLALGNVERFISQSRMIARKLLLTHIDKTREHTLEGIIEALASKLFFHGHPINRIEARELGLNVLENVPPETETAMWELYLDFEDELQMTQHYDPLGELMLNVAAPTGPPGYYAELARIEKEITWAIVESVRLSSKFKTRVRYTLNADPQGQQSIGTTTLHQMWDQTVYQPPPA